MTHQLPTLISSGPQPIDAEASGTANLRAHGDPHSAGPEPAPQTRGRALGSTPSGSGCPDDGDLRLAFVVGIVLTLVNTDQQSGLPQSVRQHGLRRPDSSGLRHGFHVGTGDHRRILVNHTNLQVAVKPIPSLPRSMPSSGEGYNPSIQDVIAVEQHLKSERNEAALIAGGLIVGLPRHGQEAKGMACDA